MKKFFGLILALILALSLTTMAWGEGNVAKVGDTEYATIDEAIAAWTNGTTLTLLSDVTLSDVIKLSSTEYHVLDLGTYTMTAASKKDAIQLVNNGRSSASYALDIKADATNPGGITATGKTIVLTAGKSGVKDRPIIRFYGGVFNASNIVKHSGSNGTNCPQFYFYGGEFNGNISTNRTLNQFYGGTFNGSLMMSVDSSAYTLISGGTFKQLSNLYMSALNSGKFTIGSAKGVYDREVYINDEGYYVVATADPAEGFEAAVAKTPGTNDYLAYSKVATDGQLNYTDVVTALEKNKTATVTVYVDELDLTGRSFSGTIVVPEGKTLTITNAPADLETEGEGNAIFLYAVAFDANEGTGAMNPIIVNAGDYTLPANSFSAPVGKQFKGWATSADGAVIDSPTYNVSEPVTFYAQWELISYTITFNSDGGSAVAEQTVEYGKTANKPADPTKSDYTFGGWYTDVDCTTAFDFNTAITSATTLYAKWTPVYTVTFNVNGHGTVPDAQPVESGKTASEPTAPTADGYTFGGWYTDADCTMAFDFNTAITSATTLYAKWTAIPSGGYYPVETPEETPVDTPEEKPAETKPVEKPVTPPTEEEVVTPTPEDTTPVVPDEPVINEPVVDEPPVDDAPQQGSVAVWVVVGAVAVAAGAAAIIIGKKRNS